jgi:hypothetical protein
MPYLLRLTRDFAEFLEPEKKTWDKERIIQIYAWHKGVTEYVMKVNEMTDAMQRNPGCPFWT